MVVPIVGSNAVESSEVHLRYTEILICLVRSDRNWRDEGDSGVCIDFEIINI